MFGQPKNQNSVEKYKLSFGTSVEMLSLCEFYDDDKLKITSK